jgi:hypothetical protein
MYQIKSVEPLHISTDSSLSLLSEYRRYVSYDNYILYPYRMSYCIPKIISLNNDKQMTVYVPYDIRPYDTIIVQEDSSSNGTKFSINNETFVRFT